MNTVFPVLFQLFVNWQIAMKVWVLHQLMISWSFMCHCWLACSSITNHAALLPQTEKALELLGKFEKIKGAQLNLNDKYMRVLANYGRDLETVRKFYQKGKEDPPILRNVPPIAGKIVWARQLYRRIEQPMRAFKAKPEILKVRFISNFL